MITKEQVKHTGATFTPKGLADYLSEKLIQQIKESEISVLDPACGDGELLFSFGEKMLQNNINFSITGYDANSYYLSLAKERLLQFGHHKFKLINDDFLKVIDLTEDQLKFDFFSFKKSMI